MNEWLNTTFTSTVGWKTLTELVDIDHRLAGSPGEREAAELMQNKLSELGMKNVQIDEFDIVGWERESCWLQHEASGETFESFALPRSASTTVETELVDLGHGTPEDFEQADVEGSIVMVASNSPMHYDRVIHRSEKYHMAVKSGAAGFVFRNHRDGDLIRSGAVSGTDQAIGEIPAVGVSKETGLRLSRKYGGDIFSLEVTATIGETTSQNVYGEVGPDTTDRVILSAHLDGHDISESAKDDAAGIAAVIEVARALSLREDELETRVQFAGYGAEETGFIGSKHHRDDINLDTVKIILQNDGVARARDFMVHTNGFSSLEGYARSACDRFQHPVEVSPKLRLSSDHWSFVEKGVPGYLISSVPGGQNNTGYGSSRGIILTAADTLDKLDIRDLRTHAILETELAVDIAKESTKIPRRTVDDIRSQAEKENKLLKFDQYKS